jgi:hypothetical protein
MPRNILRRILAEEEAKIVASEKNQVYVRVYNTLTM